MSRLRPRGDMTDPNKTPTPDFRGQTPTKPIVLGGVQAERYEAARSEWQHGDKPTKTLQGPSPAPDHSAEVLRHDALRAKWWNDGYAAGRGDYERALLRVCERHKVSTDLAKHLQGAVREELRTGL